MGWVVLWQLQWSRPAGTPCLQWGCVLLGGAVSLSPKAVAYLLSPWVWGPFCLVSSFNKLYLNSFISLLGQWPGTSPSQLLTPT